MSEVKKCPFCKGPLCITSMTSLDGLERMGTCQSCGCLVKESYLNTRPVEDHQAEEIEACKKVVCEELGGLPDDDLLGGIQEIIRLKKDFDFNEFFIELHQANKEIEKLTSERDAAIKALSEEGRKHGQTQADNDRLAEALEWIGQQTCNRFEENDNMVCSETSDCITEWCYPCYAKSALAAHAKRPAQ